MPIDVVGQQVDVFGKLHVLGDSWEFADDRAAANSALAEENICAGSKTVREVGVDVETTVALSATRASYPYIGSNPAFQ